MINVLYSVKRGSKLEYRCKFSNDNLPFTSFCYVKHILIMWRTFSPTNEAVLIQWTRISVRPFVWCPVYFMFLFSIKTSLLCYYIILCFETYETGLFHSYVETYDTFMLLKHFHMFPKYETIVLKCFWNFSCSKHMIHM